MNGRQWVLIAPVTPQAKVLYILLDEHTDTRADELVRLGLAEPAPGRPGAFTATEAAR